MQEVDGEGRALSVWRAERSMRALSEPRDLREKLKLWWGEKPQDVGDLRSHSTRMFPGT